MTARSVVNLTVHGIGPVIRTLEPGEEQTWVSVTQFEQVLDATVGRPDVRITFDDGNSSDLEIALPRLLERGLTAEFFVLAGRLGEKGKLDTGGVRELERAGMRVGSHGWAHRDWRRIDETQAAQEFSEAHRVLAEVTGHPILRVAVPFGSYDRKVLNRVRQARVTRVYTSDGGRANPNSWLQARNSLRHDVGPEWTKRVLDGTPSMALRARRRVARVVKRVR
jgi:peptidoglycan/xylan/chitin deacetylase (PgdA/CDA1 family)